MQHLDIVEWAAVLPADVVKDGLLALRLVDGQGDGALELYPIERAARARSLIRRTISSSRASIFSRSSWMCVSGISISRSVGNVRPPGQLVVVCNGTMIAPRTDSFGERSDRRGCGRRTSCAQLPNEGAHPLGSFAGRALLDEADDGRADDGSIGKGADCADVRGGGDAEADGDGELGEPAQAGDEGGGVVGNGVLGAGDADAGDGVDEAAGVFGDGA